MGGVREQVQQVVLLLFRSDNNPHPSRDEKEGWMGALEGGDNGAISARAREGKVRRGVRR